MPLGKAPAAPQSGQLSTALEKPFTFYTGKKSVLLLQLRPSLSQQAAYALHIQCMSWEEGSTPCAARGWHLRSHATTVTGCTQTNLLILQRAFPHQTTSHCNPDPRSQHRACVTLSGSQELEVYSTPGTEQMN